MHKNNVGDVAKCHVALERREPWSLPASQQQYDRRTCQDQCPGYVWQEAAQIRDEYLELKREEAERKAAKVAAAIATELPAEVAQESTRRLKVADVSEPQNTPEIAPGQWRVHSVDSVGWWQCKGCVPLFLSNDLVYIMRRLRIKPCGCFIWFNCTTYFGLEPCTQGMATCLTPRCCTLNLPKSLHQSAINLPVGLLCVMCFILFVGASFLGYEFQAWHGIWWALCLVVCDLTCEGFNRVGCLSCVVSLSHPCVWMYHYESWPIGIRAVYLSYYMMHSLNVEPFK